MFVRKRLLVGVTVASLCAGAAAEWISVQWPLDHVVAPSFGFISLGLLVALTGLTLVGVVQALWRRGWRRAALTGLTGVACLVGWLAVGLVAALFAMFCDADHFADDLTLPEGVELAEPLDPEERPDPGAMAVAGGVRLYKGVQGGLYEAEVWCNPGEPGGLYLRAFEMTRGVELSSPRLQRRTWCRASFDPDPARQCRHGMEFTIYEGNWGQFYGARMEVWFRPDGGAPDRKLAEGCFRIEGWMR